MQLLPHRKLTLEFLPLRGFQGLHRDLIALCQIQHHFAEGVFPQLHQELDRVAPRTTAKAVVKLFAGTNGKAGRFVVVEGT